MANWQIGLLIIFAIWFCTRRLPKMVAAYGKDKEDDRRTSELWKKLDNLGYLAGKMQMPPEIPDDIEITLDALDQMAFLSGWQRGFNEAKNVEKRGV